jgi:hypothetical protein
MLNYLIFLILIVSKVHALEMTKREFCETLELSRVDNTRVIYKVLGKSPHPAFIRTILKLIDDFQLPGPFIFHFTDHVGPKKVWSLKLSDGNHIYFSKNAPDLLLGIELEKIEKEVCQTEWTGRKNFTITYTNTVVEQFLRHTGTKESLQSTIEKRTGWKLRGSYGDKYFEDEQEFRTEELVTIIKQLMDLPPEIFKKMRIKKMTRWRYGAPLPIKSAAALYIVGEQKIIYGDRALMEKEMDVYGEGTILHEMGHAYWYGQSEQFREDFSKISWIKIGNKWEKLTSNSDGFISEYSLESPEEDFADHFSAYLHQPELLFKMAPKKNDFFSKKAFTDSVYFTTVAENAKIKIDSPTPDTKPPWLEKEYKDSLKLEVKKREGNSKIADIKLEIWGAFDDLSGISACLMTLEHVEDSNYKIFLNLNAQKQENGSYKLTAIAQSDPKKLAPGLFRLRNLPLTDLAGNKKFYESTSIPEVFIDGFLSLNKPGIGDVDISKISLEKLASVDGYPGIKLNLPIKYQENFESVHVTWEFEALEGKTLHVCYPSFIRRVDYPCLLTQNFGDSLSFQSYFKKEYPNSKIKLASISIFHKATTKSAKYSQDIIIPVNTPHLATEIMTGRDKLELIDLEVNQMKLKAITEVNDVGGDQNIEITLPLLNHQAGKYYIMTTIRSPKGKQILKITNEDSKISNGTVLMENEMKFIRFKVPLQKNPEDGEYMLESFEVKTQYARRPNLPLDQNNLAVKKIKLIERGIKRSFTITNEKLTKFN